MLEILGYVANWQGGFIEGLVSNFLAPASNSLWPRKQGDRQWQSREVKRIGAFQYFQLKYSVKKPSKFFIRP